jgi:alpha-galactosidase
VIESCIGQIKKGMAVRLAAVAFLGGAGVLQLPAQVPIKEQGLKVTVNPGDGRYSIAMAGSTTVAMRAGVGVEVENNWIHASDFPHHVVEQSRVTGYLGQAVDWKVTYSGISGQPDLIYHLRAYSSEPFCDIQVTVRNTTGKTIHIDSIRSLDSTEGPILDLGAPAVKDRVLSDSFSEDRPVITVHELSDAERQMHRAVGSQLIYNQQSHQSLFLGALTSDRFLTILRLHLAPSDNNPPRLLNYEVDSTGTTEMAKENSLRLSKAEDQVDLSLPVAPEEELSSERMVFSLSTDYHKQLEVYGSLIRQIHHARISAPPLMGWWSWTAYYFGLNEGTAITNAEWESEHLKSFGYNIFHIDEGYQYARGEYATPDATLFPHGLDAVYYKVHELGLVPAIWTAPFQVSERSWVCQNHPDWLVKNAGGRPIHAGSVINKKDQLFVLDTTNPGAQSYLRKTYSVLAKDWGIRYIKLDFMDDSAIEGFYYKPNTTALEAQRIGLQIIRNTVGTDVYLDKDGSVMLNPVGYVDYGRISEDTGHTFDLSKKSASGIAARYYMNRTFFVSDPDAFTVSKQTIEDYAREWNKPLTLDEARVSIALAAVSGGMFEIGDDLPMLSNDHERETLIENQDLITMVRLGHASVPLDLMNFAGEDGQPSFFFLQEDRRQSVLTIFNWTDNERNRTFDLKITGLPASGQYTVTDILERKEIPVSNSEVVTLSQSPHSVRVLKITDAHIRAVAPLVTSDHPSRGNVGDTLSFVGHIRDGDPVLSYHWDFGDGVTLDGSDVTHAYTEPGEYSVHLTATSLDDLSSEDHFQVRVSGHMTTTFAPESNTRFESTR